MENIHVIVDSMSRQGCNNISLTLVPIDQGITLPLWQAGSHIDVHLPNNISRPYSLTGNPQDHSHYQLCIKKEDLSRGGSKYVHEQLRVGQTLQISAPRQAFALQETTTYILIAAGIGITPILAMAESLDIQKKPFTLLYYVKNHNFTAMKKRLSTGFKYGKVHVLCSDQGESLRSITPEILKTPNIDTHIYLCGPEGFMSYCHEITKAEGWLDTQLFTEAFHPPTRIADDLATDTFIVKLRSSGQSYNVPSDKTIAHVLQEHDIYVPLSCEMGMCGACLTKVHCGEIDHQDTVQTDEEKSATEQYIALCCSRAKSATLEIDL
ncbi:oxidoreductase [Acinetobacter sp. B5B]|uniref:PDR/VanB family oxidoreductase n=1 Tax=Acinetobacter baretiae TaxID=2605383 RepID=UPI0018C207B1|nr:PDR/VanB family oxidoreductase [Acinetobacter baretiae]MBF7683053.1 oxidoreductase [Acinetobacter baretiae]